MLWFINSETILLELFTETTADLGDLRQHEPWDHGTMGIGTVQNNTALFDFLSTLLSLQCLCWQATRTKRNISVFSLLRGQCTLAHICLK